MGIFLVGTYDIVSRISYHYNGVLLASVIILWINFQRTKSASIGQKPWTPHNESMLFKPMAVSSLQKFWCALF